ncbi:MAG: class IV adenylate cyclase [Acidobacteriaceae bacterium]
MSTVEIELKFPVADIASFESHLTELGFQLDTPRTFESNTLYDTPARDLRQQGQLLRVRQYGELWTLTHKARPANESDWPAQYKHRIETETTLADGAAMAAIFRQLGYEPVFHYEKWRAEWSDSVGHLVIDETPIGNFAELEGPTEWIDRTLHLLEIDPSICITESYGKLFLAWKENSGSPAEHLTFADVLGQPV